MYFYRQSLEKHFHHIHSYLPPNSYPNSASSRSYYQTPTSVHSPVPSAPSSDKHASTKSCQLADGIGVRGGGGGGEGGDGGGEEAERRTQVLLDCIARPRRTGDGVGARKFRLKRSSVEKHVSLRRRRRGSSPRGNVVVERRSGSKHISHISHLRCVPTPNVLVERRSGIKHISHISHLRCVPTPNVLVERRSGMKHTFHSSHLRCVPTPNVLVERRSVIKHIYIVVTFPVSHFEMSPLNVLLPPKP